MKDLSEFKELLHLHGYRATPTRISLLALLAESKKPLSIKDLQESLTMDLVTLYRSLEAFVQKGIVRQIDFRHGHAHYELIKGGTDHHHIVCTICKKVEDFSDCTIEKITHNILKKSKSFNTINDHTLELFSVCATCKE